MPSSINAEEAVLSAMLMDDMAIISVREIVSPLDFYSSGTRNIYQAMCALKDSGSVVDPLTLSERLHLDGLLESSGGKDYIGHLIDAVPTAANVLYHARILRETGDRRTAIRVSDTLREEAISGKRPIAQVAAETQSLLLPVAAGTSEVGFRHVSEVIPEIYTDFERAENGEQLGYKFGFREIDRQTGGMMPGELAFLCGVPGGLKTIMLITICILGAMRGEGAMIFSCEMTAKALVKRLVQYLSRVGSMSLRTGQFADGEAVAIGQALGVISNLPLWIDQTPTPDIDLCIARAKALKAKHPNIRRVGVDFIQLIESQTSEDNRARELATISYKLKGLAKTTDTALVATCAVDATGIEKRSDKRPHLSDIQWSQAMRQSADMIGMLYRPSMYSDALDRDILEVDWPKFRDGAPFKVNLNWEGKTMRLTDL